MKPIIEPHVHMIARTTDDYMAMYAHGIRVCVEPSFWLGENRRYAGSFFDYFRLSLEFEHTRAARYGVDHWSAIGMNPKEAEDRALADAVIDGMGEYLDHPRCVAMGEIGFNNITPNEEHALVRQLRMAEERKMPVVLHLPHFNKLKGITRVLEIIKAEGLTRERIDIDHNVEETIGLALESGCYAGMTVYPYSKLSPERVSAMIREHGHERVIVNGSLSDCYAGREDVRVVDLPANDIAMEAGDVRAANMVALGVLCAMTGVVRDKSIVNCLQEKFFAKPRVLECNQKAFEAGIGFVNKK